MKSSRAGMAFRLWLLALLLVLEMSGCTAGRVTPLGRVQAMDPPPKTIALAPTGGIFADLIGMALSEHGYAIVGTGATAALIVLMRTSVNDLLSPPVLGMLKARAVDAVLVVEKVEAEDGFPQRARVRLYSTDQGGQVGGIEWENSWIRRRALEAADEIAAAIDRESRPLNGNIGAEPGVAFPTGPAE